MKGEIPIITNLATSSAITVVENKIPSVSNLVKQTDYNKIINELEMKITDHNHDKFITTPELYKLAAETFTARLQQANLVTKTDFDNKLTSFNKQITSNKTKRLEFGKKLDSLITKDYNFFGRRIYFTSNDRSQNMFCLSTST